MDFNQKEVDVSLKYRVPDLSSVSTSMCDSAGNLLFYSNGCGIYGSNDSLLQNGDNINPGELHDKFCNDPYLAVYISGKQSLLTDIHGLAKAILAIMRRHLPFADERSHRDKIRNN
ncbi:MAG: hypothetical protein ABMA02_14225, partial [Saprospiraceae bacterium]